MIFSALTLNAEAVAVLSIFLVALLGMTSWGFTQVYRQITSATERLEGKVDSLTTTVNGLQNSLDNSRARIAHLAKENRRLSRLVNGLFRALHSWDVLMARRFPELVGLSVQMPNLEADDQGNDADLDD